MDGINHNTIPYDLQPLVYFIGPELKRGALVKIGTTGDIAKRFRQLELTSPVPLTLHSVVLGSLDHEAELHRRFAKYRAHGEWFRITPTLEGHILGFRDIFLENMRRLNQGDI